jgi:hypothetical protein
MRPSLMIVLLLLPCALSASDDDWGVRICGQVMFGTSELEPGGAVEIPFGEDNPLMLRPEIFFNHDADLGGGVSVLWRLPIDAVPSDHALWAGPRGVLHNEDEDDEDNEDASGWEIDFMALYNIPVSQDGKHNIEFLAAIGFLQEKHGGDEDDDLVLGASIGAAYAFRF